MGGDRPGGDRCRAGSGVRDPRGGRVSCPRRHPARRPPPAAGEPAASRLRRCLAGGAEMQRSGQRRCPGPARIRTRMPPAVYPHRSAAGCRCLLLPARVLEEVHGRIGCRLQEHVEDGPEPAQEDEREDDGEVHRDDPGAGDEQDAAQVLPAEGVGPVVQGEGEGVVEEEEERPPGGRGGRHPRSAGPRSRGRPCSPGERIRSSGLRRNPQGSAATVSSGLPACRSRSCHRW